MNRFFLSFQAVNDELFGAIKNNTQLTAANTSRDEIFWITFGISLIALAVAIGSYQYARKTYLSQKQTETNTLRLPLDMQWNLLIDTIRHLYRNLIVTYAIKTKLEACGFDSYPSEEHLVKLRIPLENLHLEIFNEDKHYQEMSDLFFKIRNYNEEIDIACRHFMSPTIDKTVKRRDIETLMFKPGFLAQCIIEKIGKIWKDDKKDGKIQAIRVITQAHGKNVEDNQPVSEPPANYVRYENINDKFIKALYDAESAKEFFDMFNTDVLIECGVNSQNSPKIFMIKH